MASEPTYEFTKEEIRSLIQDCIATMKDSKLIYSPSSGEANKKAVREVIESTISPYYPPSASASDSLPGILENMDRDFATVRNVKRAWFGG